MIIIKTHNRFYEYNLGHLLSLLGCVLVCVGNNLKNLSYLCNSESRGQLFTIIIFILHFSSAEEQFWSRQTSFLSRH